MRKARAKLYLLSVIRVFLLLLQTAIALFPVISQFDDKARILLLAVMGVIACLQASLEITVALGQWRQEVDEIHGPQRHEGKKMLLQPSPSLPVVAKGAKGFPSRSKKESAGAVVLHALAFLFSLLVRFSGIIIVTLFVVFILFYLSKSGGLTMLLGPLLVFTFILISYLILERQEIRRQSNAGVSKDIYRIDEVYKKLGNFSRRLRIRMIGVTWKIQKRRTLVAICLTVAFGFFAWLTQFLADRNVSKNVPFPQVAWLEDNFGFDAKTPSFTLHHFGVAKSQLKAPITTLTRVGNENNSISFTNFQRRFFAAVPGDTLKRNALQIVFRPVDSEQTPQNVLYKLKEDGIAWQNTDDGYTTYLLPLQFKVEGFSNSYLRTIVFRARLWSERLSYIAMWLSFIVFAFFFTNIPSIHSILAHEKSMRQRLSEVKDSLFEIKQEAIAQKQAPLIKPQDEHALRLFANIVKHLSAMSEIPLSADESMTDNYHFQRTSPYTGDVLLWLQNAPVDDETLNESFDHSIDALCEYVYTVFFVCVVHLRLETELLALINVNDAFEADIEKFVARLDSIKSSQRHEREKYCNALNGELKNLKATHERRVEAEAKLIEDAIAEELPCLQEGMIAGKAPIDAVFGKDENVSALIRGYIELAKTLLSTENHSPLPIRLPDGRVMLPSVSWHGQQVTIGSFDLRKWREEASLTGLRTSDLKSMQGKIEQLDKLNRTDIVADLLIGEEQKLSYNVRYTPFHFELHDTLDLDDSPTVHLDASPESARALEQIYAERTPESLTAGEIELAKRLLEESGRTRDVADLFSQESEGE